MFVIKLITFPEIPPQANGAGGFRPDSFEHMLGMVIDCPGLDARWRHQLIDYTVAADRASAELVVHSTPPEGVSLDRSLRIVTWLPAAHVKAHDAKGTELAAVRLDAPLQAGQLVELGGKHYRVAEQPTWPHRHPVSGTCRGDIDWQHVTLVEDPQPAHLPTPAQGGGSDSQNSPETAHPGNRPMV